MTVALIGPDGAGKTTVARRVVRELRVPAKYLYMGINRDASNVMLPTSRLIRWARRERGSQRLRRHAATARDDVQPRRRRRMAAMRTTIRLANQLAEEMYRAVVAWYHAKRGRTVVFDRHFFCDYYAYDIASSGPRSLAQRIHGAFLASIYPKPDLVIFLDAPPHVLLSRKGEGTIDSLSRMRDEYLSIARVVPRFVIVDATRSEDDVAREVVRHIIHPDARA